jgi:hypothetical protein
LRAGLGIALIVLGATASRADLPETVNTGAAFRQELRRPINVYRQQVRVREIVEQLADLHSMAILLDRRLDPDRIVDVQLGQMTLQQGLEQFAAQLDADAAIIGGTVVIGPLQSLDRLRTDIALQYQTWKARTSEDESGRSLPLLLGRTFRWDALQSPSELLQQVAADFGLEVADIALVPHDLWAEGVMADVGAIEALALVAGQFDLTFEWDEDLTSIRLAQSPPRLTVEHAHSVTGMTVEDARETALRECPLAQVEPDGRRLRVVGTIGEHERIAALCTDDRNASRLPTQGPLRNRTFTLNQKRVSVIAVLRTLETLDVTVEYDPQALRQAGIDLSQKLTLSLHEASADEFFQALCEPLGLTYEIEDKTVRLKPAADR